MEVPIKSCIIFHKENEKVKFPKLAKTLTRLAEDSDPVGLFYKGNMAKDLVAEISSHGGIITAEDLSNYE